MIIDLPDTTAAAISKKLVSLRATGWWCHPRPGAHPGRSVPRTSRPSRRSARPTRPAASTRAGWLPSSGATDAAPTGSTPRSGSAATPAPARSSCCACTGSSPTTATACWCRSCCPTRRSWPGGRASAPANPERRPDRTAWPSAGSPTRQRPLGRSRPSSSGRSSTSPATPTWPGAGSRCGAGCWRPRSTSRPSSRSVRPPSPPGPTARAVSCWRPGWPGRWAARCARCGSRPGAGWSAWRWTGRPARSCCPGRTGRIATLTQPGQPDRRISLAPAVDRDCIAEELRRLDPDDIFTAVVTKGLTLLDGPAAPVTKAAAPKKTAAPKQAKPSRGDDIVSAPRTVVVHADAGLLAAAAAARLVTRLVDAQAARGHAHVVLTGGGAGIAALSALAASPARDAVDWARLRRLVGRRAVPAGRAPGPQRDPGPGGPARPGAACPSGAGAPDARRRRPLGPGRRRRGCRVRRRAGSRCGRRRARRRTGVRRADARRRARTGTWPRCSRDSPRCTSRSAPWSGCTAPPSRRRCGSR